MPEVVKANTPNENKMKKGREEREKVNASWKNEIYDLTFDDEKFHFSQFCVFVFSWLLKS